MNHIAYKRWHSPHQGFTLIELVIVIVLIGILSAVALPRFASFSQEARINTVESLARDIKSALNIFQAQVTVQSDIYGVDIFDTPIATANGMPKYFGTAEAFWMNLMDSPLPDNMSVLTKDPVTPIFGLYFDTVNCGVFYDEQDTSVTTDTSGC